jgi:lincosamide nucleotidyltransferase A/C/D/E
MQFREFHGGDVSGFINSAQQLKIPFWFEGGWGIDVLIGHQTRWHSDLDIIVESRYSPTIVHYLINDAAFENLVRPDATPWDFSLGDPKNRVIDFHVIDIDADGNGQCGPDRVYPSEALRGRTRYEGNRHQPVQCLTAKWQVRFHTGYEVDEDDGRDMLALKKRFRVRLPPQHEKFA